MPQEGAVPTSHSVCVRMPAKINLHLGIHPGRDAHGYHRVDTVMAPVGVYDTICVRPSTTPTISFDPPIAAHTASSTLGRTITTLSDAMGIDRAVSVTVVRGIPSEGGMGSASADAAAAILALCKLWGTSPDNPAVVRIAREAGADVMFFMNPIPSLLTGIGNELVETYLPIDAPVVLVKPQGGVSTAAAYAEFDRMPTPCATPDAMCRALKDGDARAVAACLHNNLADAACRLQPSIASVLAWLRTRTGVMGAQLTGSGSCVFALCTTNGAAHDIADEARRGGLWAKATHTAPTVKVTGA